MEYGYKHPSLLTLTVDAAGASSDHEWRLPTFDPRNEKKYLYKLHTVDIYFWEKEDAELFLNAARRMLPEKQMTILDEPVAPAAHHEEMSPVVQQLENVAISDPSYQKGQTRDSRPSALLPGPAVPQPEEVPEKAFSPMAYNPAAPAAPEAIRHREKTPPPEDGAANPLVAAAASDEGQAPGYNQFAPPPVSAFGPPNQPMYFAGPPQAGHANSPYAAPPPSALTRTQSFPQSVPQQVGYNVQTQQYVQHAAYPSQQTALQLPSFAPPPQYSAAPASAPPPAGYSNYQYSQGPAAPLSNNYSIHHQLYRPTEGEHAVKHKPAKPPRGQLEESAQKLEKGITGFLKKVEKKYG